MKVEKLHYGGACSSLIVFGLGEVDLYGRTVRDNDTVCTQGKINTETFRAAFLKAIEEYDNMHGHLNEGSGRSVDEHAFFVASTSQKQMNVEACLEELGFSQTERVSKAKNPEDHCILWVGTVSDVLERLGNV